MERQILRYSMYTVFSKFSGFYNIDQAFENDKLYDKSLKLLKKAKFAKTYSKHGSVNNKKFDIDYHVSALNGSRKLYFSFEPNLHKNVGQPHPVIKDMYDMSFIVNFGNLEKWAYKDYSDNANIASVNFKTEMSQYTVHYIIAPMTQKEKNENNIQSNDEFFIIKPFVQWVPIKEMNMNNMVDFVKEQSVVIKHLQEDIKHYHKGEFLFKIFSTDYHFNKRQKDKNKFEKLNKDNLENSYADNVVKEYLKTIRSANSKKEENSKKENNQDNQQQDNGKEEQENKNHKKSEFPSIIFYRLLGVKEDATQEEITKAYHKLIRKAHPDLNPNDEYLETITKKLNIAYSVLKEPKERERYDNFIKNNKEEKEWEL